MKQKTMGTIKRIIVVPLCIVILLGSIGMVLPTRLSNNTQQNIQTVQTEPSQVARSNDIPKVTSRGGYVREKVIEYKLYEFIVNENVVLYFEDIESANLQKEYLLNNTDNLTVEINEIVQNNRDNLSDEFTINNTIENYILKYKKKVTCFPTKSHTVSSRYGSRASMGDFHSGLDLSGSYGDNIYAYRAGKVIKVQYSNKSYGNMVLIQHENGMQTRYAHMSSIKVSNGEYVKCGQTIGYMGSTGNSTGVHLHFEVILNGKTVNPYNYIF